MPDDFVAHGLSFDPQEEERKRRKTAPSSGGGTDAFDNLTTVEKHSQGTLPTRVSWAVASMKERQHIIAKASKLIAKKFDVEHNYIFGSDQLKDYLDPIYDGKLKMSTVRRITGDFQLPALESILQQAAQNTRAPHGGKGIDTFTRGADPRRVATFIRQFAGYIDAQNIDATEGISMAVYLAQQKGLNPKDFKANLAAIYKWTVDTSQPKDRFGFAQQMMLAVKATKDKANLKGNLDVVGFLNPNLKKIYDKSQVPQVPGLDISGDPVAQALKKTAQAEATRPGNPSAANITTDVNTLAFQPVASAEWAALDEVQPKTDDFYAYATALQDQLKFDDKAFANSFVGKGLDYFGRASNFIFKDIIEEGIVTNVGTGIDLVGKSLGAAVPGGPNFKDAYRATFNDRKYIMTRLDSGGTVGDIVAEGYHLPHWAGAAFDFYVGWYADPFVMFGKFKGLLREERLIPGTLEKTTLAGSIGARVFPTSFANRAAELLDKAWGKTTDRIVELSGSKTSRDLFDAALEDTSYQMTRRMDTLRTTIEARSPLDFEYMQALRNRLLARYGLENIRDSATIAEKAWQEWQDGMIAHFVGFGPKGSVAEEAVLTRLGASREAVDNLLKTDPLEALTGTQLELPGIEKVTPSELVDNTLNDMWQSGWHPAFRVEVPLEAHWVPGLGFTQKLSVAFPGSKAGATELGTRTERLFSINPGRVFNASADPERYVLLHSRRWTFPEEIGREFQARAAAIVNSGIDVNGNLFNLIDEMDKAGFEALVAKNNIAPAAAEELRKAIYEPTSNYNNNSERVFGVKNTGALDETAPLREPLLETQLRYTKLVVDPVQAAKAVRQYVGTIRRMRNALLKALPGEHVAPEVIASIRGAAFQGSIDTLGEAARAYRRTWKAGAVARVAYTPRVILMDEGARSLATTQSLTERLLAQKLTADAAQTRIGRFVGNVEERTVGRIADSGLFDQTIKIGDGSVTVFRPGRYEYEGLAVGKVRETEVLDETLRNASQWNKAMQADGSWTIVKPGQTQYWGALEGALTREFANSRPGVVAMQAIRDGKTISQTEDLLKQWAIKDNYNTLETTIGVQRTSVDEWATNVANMAYSYTGGKAEIANAVINKAPDLGTLLQSKIPADLLPEVHGPSLNMLLGGTGTPVGTKLVNNAYRYLVQLPEDVLNRQPTYAIWKRRAELSSYEALGRDVEGAFKSYDEAAAELKTFVESRVNSTLALGEEQYVTKSLRAAQTLRNGEDLGDGIKVLRKDGGKTYYADVEDGKVVGFRSVSSDGRVETIVDPAYQRQGIGTKLLKAHWKDEGVYEAADQLAAAKRLVEHQQFTAEGAALNKKALDELLPKPTGGLAPEVQHAIDISSREFALAQTKKIMFDFSEQRRFQELMSFVIPFSQPFFEGFQAWGNIALRRAPETIGRARALWQFGEDTGFIREDSFGNKVIPLTALFKPFMWAGLLPDSFSFVTPVTSLNMLAQTTIPVPTRGFLGKVAGGAPIPIPSFDPLAALALQWGFTGTTNDIITQALFQHGPSATLLPPTVAKVLSFINPEITGEDKRVDGYTLQFLRLYQYAGMHDDLSPDELVAQAKHDAGQLNTMRNLVGFVSPGAPQVVWPQHDLQDKYFDYIATYGPEAGTEKFNQEHPDLRLLTIGMTTWTPDIEGRSQVRIPTSEYASKLLGSSEFADLMKRYPEYGAIFLIGADPSLSESYDFATAARLAHDGITRYKSPTRFLAEGETNVSVYPNPIDIIHPRVGDQKDIVSAWEEVDRFNTMYYRMYDQLHDQGLGDDNVKVLALKDVQLQFLTDMHERFPLWGRDNLKEVPDGKGGVLGYTWKFEGSEPAPALLINHARALVTTPGLEKFPGIIALRTYLEGRDEIAQDMTKAHINDITSASAEKAGLTKRYDALIAGLEKTYPDFSPFLNNYFRGDLTGMPSADLQFVRNLTPDQLTETETFDTRFEGFLDSTRTMNTDWERSAAYQQARELQERKLAKDPQLIEAWWNGLKSPAERQDYKTGLAFRIPVFMGQFDMKQMGIKLTDTSAAWLREMGAMRVEVERKSWEDPAHYDKGAGYARIEAFANNHMKGKSKDARTFTEAIKAIDTWGWGAEAAGLDKQPGKVGAAWKNVLAAAHSYQSQVDQQKLTPYDDAYKQARRDLETYVEDWQKYAPNFKKQWLTYQEDYYSGTPLINWLMPDVYFPISTHRTYYDKP